MRNSISFLNTESADEILAQIQLMRFKPLRIVIFNTSETGDDDKRSKAAWQAAIVKYFSDCPPVLSYVNQAPLCCETALEFWYEPKEAEYKIEYKNAQIPYITLSRGAEKRVIIGGVESENINIKEQSNEIFSIIENILSLEKMPINSIVRQWNYIENITSKENDSQNYQEFNDARSDFYAKDIWMEGYPAATGIGTQSGGGVVVDVDAVLGVDIRPIDNALQVAAHAYSPEVLIGESAQKTSPKFERAKLVDNLLYISGTAAIRGKESLVGISAGEQTRITLENIDALLESADCLSARSLRVYIKNKGDYEQVKKVVEEYTQEPALYLFADICREELLVEIEAIAIKY